MRRPSASRFHGLEIGVRSVTGAQALRVVHPGGQQIDAHRHDWPLLTIPVLGGYDEYTDGSTVELAGAVVALHPAGCCHANCIHENGMETSSIEFDPDWAELRRFGLTIDRSFYWAGGSIVMEARNLVRMWHSAADETQLRRATTAFLQRALTYEPVALPPWLRDVTRLSADPAHTTEMIARTVDLHPAWMARAYRTATGEGLHETRRRRLAERAVHLLRSTDDAIAEIAAEAGFCDQSHLHRAMRHFTGRTPYQIRAERKRLQELLVTS